MSRADAVLPYLLLGDTRRRALADQVRDAAVRWRRRWADEQAEAVGAEVQDAVSRTSMLHGLETACLRASAEDLAVGILVPARALAHIVGVHGAPAELTDLGLGHGGLAEGLECEAFKGLADELFAGRGARQLAVQRVERTAPDWMRELATGRYVFVLLTLGEAKGNLLLALSPALVETLLPGRKAFAGPERVERRIAAAAEEPIQVEALLGQAEVSIAELARLSVADVIVLDDSWSSAGELAIAGGSRVWRVLPGQHEGRRAVQLHVVNSKGNSR